MFDNWPKRSKPVLALAAMIILGGIWIGIPLLSALRLVESNVPSSGAVDYSPMMAVLIAMTTATVAGIFLFMTLRIDRGTRLRAKSVASKAVKRKAEKFAKELEKMETVWTQKRIEMETAWARKCAEMATAWRQKHTEMETAWTGKRTEMETAWTRKRAEMETAWTRKRAEMETAWTQKCADMEEAHQQTLDALKANIRKDNKEALDQAKQELAKAEEELRATLDKQTNAELVRDAVQARITEDVLREHVEAVLMLDANVQTVREYVNERAQALDEEAIKRLIGLLNELVDRLSQRLPEEREEEGEEEGEGEESFFARAKRRFRK